jgi:7-dehydrocholesterol reductase
MYTLQTQYLARNAVMLPSVRAAAILFTGVCGYVLFRSVNHQKDLVRHTDGNYKLWDLKHELSLLSIKTSDGLEHESLLLCSGWWGLARHVNYLGDLILSYSMCATCGFTSLFPWTYAIFMTVLLIHRCWRDEERCSKKYGKG